MMITRATVAGSYCKQESTVCGRDGFGDKVTRLGVASAAIATQ